MNVCSLLFNEERERERIRGRKIDVKESQKRGHHGRGGQLWEMNQALYMNPKKKPKERVTLWLKDLEEMRERKKKKAIL